MRIGLTCECACPFYLIDLFRKLLSESKNTLEVSSYMRISELFYHHAYTKQRAI